MNLFQSVAESFSNPDRPQTVAQVAWDFAFNFLAIYALACLIYYRRHHDHRMQFLLLAFNLFLFPVFVFHSSVSAGFGFTIFALLALVRLRSDTFDKAEVSYLLGSLALTFVNALLPSGVQIVAVLVILLTAYFADHPSLWKPACQTVRLRYQLAETDLARSLDLEFLRERIGRDYGIVVTGLELDQVEGNQVRLWVTYRMPGSAASTRDAEANHAGRAITFFSFTGSRPK